MSGNAQVDVVELTELSKDAMEPVAGGDYHALGDDNNDDAADNDDDKINNIECTKDPDTDITTEQAEDNDVQPIHEGDEYQDEDFRPPFYHHHARYKYRKEWLALGILVVGAVLIRVIVGAALRRSTYNQHQPSVVDGRPFRERFDSAPIFASTLIRDACVTNEDCRAWQSVSGLEDLDPHSNLPGFNSEENVQKWTHRALGEHASIASFATFVVALMTHQAPPDLIQQALTAAQDELRHARLAFARVGTGPTALPSTRLDIVQNFTLLALAVAQEGCIDETLSALELAMDAQDESTTLVDRRLLESISLDEANHASLAWRTVKWICLKDELACDVVQKELLNLERLSVAVSERFQYNLERTHECARLFRFLLRWLRNHQTDNVKMICLSGTFAQDGKEPLASNALGKVITVIHQDICPNGSASSGSQLGSRKG